MFLLQAGSFLLCHGSIRTSVVSFYVSSFHCRDSLSTFSIPDHEIGESSKQTYSAILNAASFFPNSQTPIKNRGFELGFRTPVVDFPGIGQSPPWGDVSDDLEVFKEAMKMFTAISSQQKTNGDLRKDRFMKMNNICIHINIFSKIECSTYYIIICVYIYNYIHICLYIYIYIYIRIYLYIYIYAHRYCQYNIFA